MAVDFVAKRFEQKLSKFAPIAQNVPGKQPTVLATVSRNVDGFFRSAVFQKDPVAAQSFVGVGDNDLGRFGSHPGVVECGEKVLILLAAKIGVEVPNRQSGNGKFDQGVVTLGFDGDPSTGLERLVGKVGEIEFDRVQVSVFGRKKVNALVVNRFAKFSQATGKR